MNTLVTSIHNDIIPPERLNCPFYYQPHDISLHAIEETKKEILRMSEWQEEVLRQGLQGELEWSDGHKHLHRTGRGQPHTAPDSQPGSHHCQSRILLHTTRGAEDSGRGPGLHIHTEALHHGRAEVLRDRSGRYAQVRFGRYLPSSQQPLV